MTNLCTKVTVRKRPIKNGQTSLYLDFYPPIRNPKTGRLSRREYLGLYIYSNPTEKFQQEYNRSIMQKYGLGKTQVRRFAETHGVRIKKAKGGRANLYLKADWEAARKNAEKTSASTKAKRT